MNINIIYFFQQKYFWMNISNRKYIILIGVLTLMVACQTTIPYNGEYEDERFWAYDEDGDLVKLQIRTGVDTIIFYIIIGIVAMAIVAGGVVGIKILRG